MGFPGQEYWCGVPFPSPRDLPNPGTESASPASADGFFTTEPPGKHMETGKCSRSVLSSPAGLMAKCSPAHCIFVSLLNPYNMSSIICNINIFPLHACMHAKLLQSCLTLCTPMDCSPPGSSVHGFSKQEYWSKLPGPSPGALPTQGPKPHFLSLLHWQAGSLPQVPRSRGLERI